MNQNLDADSTFTYEQFGEAPPADAAPAILPSGTIFVSNINGIAGNITFVGGTSGFSYSVAGSQITLVSPLTTKGDIYTRDGTNGTRLAVGANDAFLQADSGQATGLKWILGQTGWNAWSGTASRATQNADANTTASAVYDAAEVQAIADRLRDTRRVMKAMIDDLMALKALKT